MQNVGRMNIFKASQNLIYKVLNMVYGEWLFTINNAMQICLHQVLNNIHIFEVFRGARRRNYINYPNNLYMQEEIIGSITKRADSNIHG
jgi:hypothetical protein